MVVKKLKMAVRVFLAVGLVGMAAAERAPVPHAIDDVSRLPPEAARLYAYVRTPLVPSELAYRQIPWLVDLNEGLRVAREQKRPLLLWTSGDDPLDRC
jgi:hypothetical protein